MPNNRIVNFQMQQPGDMANPQVVGVQQQNRLSLAERLRKYGLDQDQSGAQSFSDSFNQQMRYPMRPEEPLTPQQQQAGQIMKAYNAKGGGHEAGWKPSAPMSAQRGMMGAAARTGGAISRGASNAGGAISRGFGSAVGGIGKLFA
jgi:hypothetical protein